MKPERDTRSAWIKLRVTPAEKEAIAAKSAAQGQTVTDFIRQRALDYRLRQTPLEKERVRQLARIGANLNQLARWANIHKSRAEALDVLTALVSLENAVRTDTPPAQSRIRGSAMYMKIFPHGQGAGEGPTNYLVREDYPGRDAYLPDVLRGDPEVTRELIDSLDTKWRFTAGELSWHPDDTVTPEQEQCVMDDFEALAFARLEAEQRNILWVRHVHAGHYELHFVIPRVELATGKAFNPCPPGWQKHFDLFRDLHNHREGWGRPDDPARMRMYTPPMRICTGRGCSAEARRPSRMIEPPPRRPFTNTCWPRWNWGRPPTAPRCSWPCKRPGWKSTGRARIISPSKTPTAGRNYA